MNSTTNNTNNLRYLVSERRLPSSTSQGNSKDATIAAPSTPTQPTPVQPITTIVPLLNKTVYDEAGETEESERTLGYVRVQLKVLKYLASFPSDMLGGRQVCEWTGMISPSDFKPTAQEALRVCYYLRSQGFDTFAKFKRGYMKLYFVDQQSNKRSLHVDVLYWKQDTKTNDIRRNAVAPSRHITEGRLLYEYYYGYPEEQQRYDQRTLESLATRASAAEIRLQNLVVGENPDPGEMEVTLMQLEEYRAMFRGN